MKMDADVRFEDADHCDFDSIDKLETDDKSKAGEKEQANQTSANGHGGYCFWFHSFFMIFNCCLCKFW